jgi:hypothetical protein
MKNSVLISQFGAVLLVLSATGSAYATPLTFDFNTLSANGNNAAVQTYMNTKLGSAGSVTVTGAQADNNYTGDDHVVGSGPWYNANSITLGNTEGATKDGAPYTPGATDRFITNQPGTTTSIVMKFTGLTIVSVSFDYEIFPDASCADGNHCGGVANYPDFKFLVNGTTQIFQSFGVMPGTNGTYSTSPASWIFGETAPQLLTKTALLILPVGVKELDFVDWPAAIGIDNLTINYDPISSPVPEPASLVLFGTGLLGVARQILKRKK